MTTIKDLKKNDVFIFNNKTYVVRRKWLSDEKPLIAHLDSHIKTEERFGYDGLEVILKADLTTTLYNIQYYNEKGTILKETQIRAKNMDDAQTNFKFHYPTKIIWKITAV